MNLRTLLSAVSLSLSFGLIFPGTSITSQAQSSPPRLQQTQPEKTESAPVASTVLVTALSKDRTPVELSASDLEIKADERDTTIGEVRRLTNTPLQYCLLFDVSGSQRDRFKKQQELATSVLTKLVQPGRDYGLLVSFNDQVFLDAEDTDPGKLIAAIANERARGGTAVYDAMANCSNRMMNHAPDAGLRLMLILSDGEDNASHLTREAAKLAVTNAGMRVYAISYEENDKGRAALNFFADESGGKTYFPRSEKDLTKVLDAISSELANLFSVTFTPAHPLPDDRPYKLDVKCRKPDVVLMAPRQYQKPDPRQADLQQRAEALIERSRRLSDIRAKNAPAFHLKATFSFTNKDLEPAQGTYTEVWVSNAQWRRETVTGPFHRIEVGGPDRRWVLDNTKDFPETAARVPDLMNMFPPNPSTFDFESIKEDPEQHNVAECAITKPGFREVRYAFCFDKKSGGLLERLSPEIRPKNTVNYACFYGIFRPFGDFWFPREMACFEDKHKKLDAKIEELSAEPSPDAALFKPPPGAVERVECSGIKVPPRGTSTPPANFPIGSEEQESSVLLSLVVGKDGKPQDITVKRSGGKGFDQQALNSISRWRFTPGTCNGEAVPMEIAVDVDFHH